MSDDTATSSGATNVFLTQRSANVPYRREEVGIQGDENPWKALGFNAGGALTAISAAEMIAADPEAAQAALGPISENPFTAVDTEAQFDAALAAGRSIALRGEGSGGVIDLTTTKEINTARTIIEGPAHLRFTVPPAAEVRCLWVSATDVTLRDFEMSSTLALELSNQDGINFPAYDPCRSHRAKLQRLDLHNFNYCISKWGGLPTPFTDDILIEDCYIHTFQSGGIYLTHGVRRSTVRRCRVLGKQPGETHLQTSNAVSGTGNCEDMLFEDCLFGMCAAMGIELTTVVGGTNIRPKIVRCRIIDTNSFGVSFGHCIQGYGENIIVTGAKGVGIEVAGDTVTGRCENTILVACDVRNVTNHPTGGFIAGYTADGTTDTILLGCRATNITSVPSNEANGVLVCDSDRAVISDCVFLDAGATGVQLWHGIDFPNTNGFHVVQGCTFRHTKALTDVGVQKSVFVSNINAIIRNNTSFQRPGGSLIYTAACTAGAAVCCDDAGAPIVTGEFTGSNRIIAVPS